MNNKYLAMGIGGLVLVALGLGGWYLQSSSNNNQVDNSYQTVATSTTRTPLPLTVNVKHFYSGGVHYYRGLVETPTPCWDVSATSTSNADTSRTIVINTYDRGGVCAEHIAQQSFEVSFTGAQNTAVTALLNGKPAQLNVIEAGSKNDLQGPFDFKS